MAEANCVGCGHRFKSQTGSGRCISRPGSCRCNAAAGNRRDQGRGLRWSRRWFDDAPDGTAVVGVEIRHNGGWEPL